MVSTVKDGFKLYESIQMGPGLEERAGMAFMKDGSLENKRISSENKMEESGQGARGFLAIQIVFCPDIPAQKEEKELNPKDKAS